MTLTTDSTELKFGESSIDFHAERDELHTAVLHIYRAFMSPDVPVASFADPSPIVHENGPWRATVGGEKIEAANFGVALWKIEDAIANQLLAGVGECLLVHAAAVAEAESTTLLVGLSGSGKTTLALELVRRGMTFLTDEYVVLSRCGTLIYPFPRAATRKFDSPIPAGLNVASGIGSRFRTHFLPEDRASLGPRKVGDCQIIFPEFNENASPEAAKLTSAEAGSMILPSVFDFENREQKQWPAIANLVTASRCCTLKFQCAAIDLDFALNALR